MDLLPGEPLTKLTSFLQKLNHELLLELPDVRLGQPPLLIVIQERAGQAQEVILARHVTPNLHGLPFSLQQQEESQDTDGAVVGIQLLHVHAGVVEADPGQDLTLLCMILPVAAVVAADREAAALTHHLVVRGEPPEALETLGWTAGVRPHYSRGLHTDKLSLLYFPRSYQNSP